MFTGIIEEMGTVKSIRKSANSAILTIGATKVLEETKIGDSIAAVYYTHLDVYKRQSLYRPAIAE